ncbi:MAG: hypothetical protein ABI565_08095, partial [Vicinamibacteria bacterium]
MLGLLFLAIDRLFRRSPRGDRALFEKWIGGQAPEIIAAKAGRTRGSPSLKTALSRMAAHKRLSITIESPATDETEALVRLRLNTDGSKLNPFEARLVDRLFSQSDEVTSEDVQKRHRGREFDPDDLVEGVVRDLRPPSKPATRP